MELEFEVQRVNPSSQSKSVTYDNSVVTAVVNTLEVELVDPKNNHGSLTLRFYKQSEIDEAKQTFILGKSVIVAVD